MMQARIAIDTDAESRREPRREVAADLSLRPLGAFPIEARLLNISSHGFMAETPADLRPGARIWVTLPGQARVNARLVWARDGRIGGEFAEAIDPLAVIHAAGRAGSS